MFSRGIILFNEKKNFLGAALLEQAFDSSMKGRSDAENVPRIANHKKWENLSS